MPPLQPFEFTLPGDTFENPDEGDVLTVTAHLSGKHWLPAWLDFDPETLCFSGITPRDIGSQTRLTVRATDFDGDWAEGELVLWHRDPGNS